MATNKRVRNNPMDAEPAKVDVEPAQQEPAQQEESTMTEQTVTTSPEDIQNPDMVLFEAAQAAKKTIEEWNARLEAIKGLMRKRDSNYTDDQIKAVRDQFDDWLKKRYPVAVVFKALRTEIDIYGWSPKIEGDDVKFHPTIEALARQQLAGSINTPSMRDLKQSAFDYVQDIRDEEGGQVLTTLDLDHLKTAFGLVAAPPAAAKKKPGRPASKKDADDEKGDTGNIGKEVKYPGTDVEFKISYNVNTGKYSFRGQSADSLSKKLASVSIYKTTDEVKAEVENLGKHLFPEAKQ